MNWVFTDTTLHLSNWLQSEDIYANVYLLKCARLTQNKYPTKRGLPRPKSKKYNFGGCLLILLIIVIWFPLVVFSSTSSFYQPNPPREVNVEIKLGGYLPIYRMIAEDINLKEFKPDDSRKLREKINSLSIPPALKDSANAFLRDFNPGDIQCVNLFALSVDLWKISQPIRDIVVSNLRSDVTIPVRFSYTITRNPSNQDNSGNFAAVVTRENTVGDLHNQKYLSMMFFNDKVSPANISFLTRYEIIGSYTTFVIVVARLLRTSFPKSHTIMFNEVPNVERLWRLLRAIDLVREHNLLRIEEELFTKLLFSYRSPESLIRFSKLKLD